MEETRLLQLLDISFDFTEETLIQSPWRIGIFVGTCSGIGIHLPWLVTGVTIHPPAILPAFAIVNIFSLLFAITYGTTAIFSPVKRRRWQALWYGGWLSGSSFLATTIWFFLGISLQILI